jgi:hypothetical protein
MVGFKGVKYAPMPPENGKKTGGFPHFLAISCFSLKNT